MKYMQPGIKNEYTFARLIDGKKIKQLPQKIQELLYVLYDNINEENLVECWKSKYNEKADIKVKINGIMKGLSLKTGQNCTIHQENVSKFYPFLERIGFTSKSLQYLKNFMRGLVAGEKVNSQTYIDNNLSEFYYLKKSFNAIYIKANIIMRSLFQGTESQKYGCDAIIYGTPEDFVWATKEEIFIFLLNYPAPKNLTLKSGALTIKPYDRNLKNNPQRAKYQNDIQIKWLTLPQDLIYITQIRNLQLHQTFSTPSPTLLINLTSLYFANLIANSQIQ